MKKKRELTDLSKIKNPCSDRYFVETPCNIGDKVKTEIGFRFARGENKNIGMVVFIGINGVDEQGGGFVNVVNEKGAMLQFNFSDFGEKIFVFER